MRLWHDEQALRDVKKSEKQFENGKSKVLKSLRDLR